MALNDYGRNRRLKKIISHLKNKDYKKFDEKFLNLHSREQLIVFESLDAKERQAVYYLMTPREMANLFDILEVDSIHVEQYFYELDIPYAAALLTEMQKDNAADVLGELDLKRRRELLETMNASDAEEIRQLLSYEDESAGSIMTTEFISLNEESNVEETLNKLKHHAPDAETIYYLYVTDVNNHLTGVVSLRDLVVSDDETLIKDIMNSDVVSSYVDNDREEVAHLIQDYDFLAVPVLDDKNHLVGIITVDDIVDVISEEAAEDYSGLAAVSVDDRHDTPWDAAKARLPWLIILLFLGLGTSSLISVYEGLVAEVAVLASFISLVTGTAGNAGTQSLAVAIRRLTNRENQDLPGIKLFANELIIGLLTGLFVGIFSLGIVGTWKSNIYLGLIVGIAMIFAVAVSTLAGTYVPRLIDRLGFDPAVASGPFITTFTDLTSVFIYFSVAQLFLPYLI